MERSGYCLIGSELVPESEALIPARDRGFLYGDGLFETLRVYGRKAFRLRDHWQRLTGSAGFLGFSVPPIDPEEAVSRLLSANRVDDAVIRFTLTRGTEPAGPRPGPGQPLLIGQLRPLPGHLGRRTGEGILGRRLPWPLRARGLPLQAHKTLAYLPSVLALGAALEGEEPILENTEGHVAEGATTNVFWIRDGTVRTPRPEAGCLPGIARALVLELSQTIGISVEEGFWPWAELVDSAEAFVTNSVVEILPLVRLEGEPLGIGRPGPVTRSLQTAYRRAVEEETGR